MVLNKDNSSSDEDWEVVSDDLGDDTAPQQQSSSTPDAMEEQPNPDVTPERGMETAQPEEQMAAAETETTVEYDGGMDDENGAVTKEEDNNKNTVEEEAPSTFSNAIDEQEPLLAEPAATNEVSTEEIPVAPSIQPEGQQQQSQPPPAAARNNNTANLPRWLRVSLNKIGDAIKEVDEKHHIQMKARNSVKTVGDSLHKLGDSIQKEATTAKAVLDRESVKLTQTIQQKADEVDWNAKTKAVELKAKEAAHTVEEGAKKLGATVKTGAAQAGEKVKTLNKDGKVTDFLVAAAVVGGAVLLAKGKPGAGAAFMATGGAAYAAGEAAKQPRRYSAGLNEDLHMD